MIYPENAELSRKKSTLVFSVKQIIGNAGPMRRRAAAATA